MMESNLELPKRWTQGPQRAIVCAKKYNRFDSSRPNGSRFPRNENNKQELIRLSSNAPIELIVSRITCVHENHAYLYYMADTEIVSVYLFLFFKAGCLTISGRSRLQRSQL